MFPNGKRYIGITCKRPKARWDKGRGYKKRNIPIYNAILKYGWENIEHIILFENLTEEEAKNKEGVSASRICLYLNNKRSPPENIIAHNLRYEDEDFHEFKKNKNISIE